MDSLTQNITFALASVVDTNSEGFSSQALQQGGIGLLLTVLVISVPPLAAAFFQGTVGNFLTYFGFGAAGARIGPQGQPPGSFGGGGYGAPRATFAQANTGQESMSVNSLTPMRMPNNSNAASQDVTKTAAPPTTRNP